MRTVVTMSLAGIMVFTGLGAASAGHSASTALTGVERPTAAHAPYCGIDWGSAPKHAGSMVRSPVSHVRAGEHRCFDRLVVGLGKGRRPGYRVRYVTRIIADPSGKVVPVRGGARLRIVLLAPDSRGFPISSRHLADVRGFRTFRQVVGAGSFEGYTSLGLGVRARLPFRAFTLSGPGPRWRLVIDVAHRWQS